jgi:hypothetical protein
MMSRRKKTSRRYQHSSQVRSDIDNEASFIRYNIDIAHTCIMSFLDNEEEKSQDKTTTTMALTLMHTFVASSWVLPILYDRTLKSSEMFL